MLKKKKNPDGLDKEAQTSSVRGQGVNILGSEAIQSLQQLFKFASL